VNRIRKGVTIAAVTLAVGGGVAVAATLPAGAAVSAQSPSVAVVRIGSPAVIDARGAIVQVPVNFVCSPGAQAEVFVGVNQRVGADIASGGAEQVLGTCDGTFQSATVTVFANDKAFRQGPAAATAELYVFGGGFIEGSDTRTISITKK
jgi:hypothetical protein